MEQILSEEYGDFIVNFIGTDEEATEKYGVSCFQRISSYYGSVFVPLNRLNGLVGGNVRFGAIPALYGLMERNLNVRNRELPRALEESGILNLQNQPVLNLKGQGCIMAFIDSGIDIFDEEFRFSNGDTRILRLWDMTDTWGKPPDGIMYGSEYTDEDINGILRESGSKVGDFKEGDLKEGDFIEGDFIIGGDGIDRQGRAENSELGRTENPALGRVVVRVFLSSYLKISKKNALFLFF